MNGLRQWLDASDEYRRSWERTVKPSIRSRRRRAEQILAKSVGAGNGDVLHPVSTQSGGSTGRGRTAESDQLQKLAGATLKTEIGRKETGRFDAFACEKQPLVHHQTAL
jgi:hypothetical protein